MDSENDLDEIVLIGGSYIVLLLLLLANVKSRRDRRMRVHPYLRERNDKGRFATAVTIECCIIFVIPINKQLCINFTVSGSIR